MKKRESLRQRINRISIKRILLRRKSGNIEWVTGLFFILFLVILLCAELQLSVYQAASLYLEDALAASNLASAVIDIEEYGISHKVRIADPTRAYDSYLKAVKENLQLNENWECANSTLIAGQVTIASYIVYNVEEEIVKIYYVLNNGRVREEQGMLGRVTAPNGVPVEETSIYSEISFPVKGFLGISVQAHKGKLVDIVAEEGVAEEGEENEQREDNT